MINTILNIAVITFLFSATLYFLCIVFTFVIGFIRALRKSPLDDELAFMKLVQEVRTRRGGRMP